MVRDMLEKLIKQPFPNSHPKFLITKKYKKGLELDCYNSDLKLAIEVDGIGHYQFNKFFHKTIEKFENQQKRDNDKDLLCKENDVILIRIPHQYTYKNWIELYNYLLDQLDKNGILERLDMFILN